MKAKVERGSGFRGALNYVLDEGEKRTGDKDPEVIGGTVISNSAKEMAREFAITRRLRPDIERPVWHSSLSLPPGDRLDSVKWSVVASDYMKEMGFPDDTLYTVVRHNDTDHDHIHIVASRVSLSGNVWHGKYEAMTAIKATQTLEQRHGLTLTPGFGDADSEVVKAKLTMAEVSKAERTGLKPTKETIADALNKVLERGKLAAGDFVKRLRDEFGVYAKPNWSGEKLNGFAFESDGLSFSGGQVGKGRAFAWKGLQKKGVSYEPTRDGEELANAERIAAERTAARDHDQHDVNGVAPDPGRDAAVAPGDSVGAVGGGQAVRQPRPVITGPAGHVGGNDDQSPGADQQNVGGDGAGNVNGNTSHGGEAGQPGGERQDVQHQLSQDRPRSLPDGPGGREIHQGAQRPTAANQDRHGATKESTGTQDMDTHNNADGVSDSQQRVDGNRPKPGWNARFKAASVAKRATVAPKQVPDADITNARRMDPGQYLESAGYTVKREGRHLSVRHPSGDEVYRVTKKDDGRYVACDRYQNPIGDNIALVRHVEEGVSFPDAVYRLAGGQSMYDATVNTPVAPPKPPRLPRPSQDDTNTGISYLAARGIDEDTLRAAEKQGFVKYAPGAVVFAGYDANGQLKAATRRAVDPDDEVQKRDFKGTNKHFAPVLHGSKDNVWIVEGGTDALALHSLAKRNGKDLPTVIVSGGSNVLSFLENKETQALIKGSTVTVIAAEREKDAETQAEVDTARAKQIQRIETLTGRKPDLWTPPPGSKDIAEFNQADLSESMKAAMKALEASEKAESTAKRGANQVSPRYHQQQPPRPQAVAPIRPKG